MFCKSSATAEIETLLGTIVAPGTSDADVEAAVTQIGTLTAAINAVEIGGTLYRAQLIEELMTPAGVINAVLSIPFADISLVASQVFTVGTLTITQENV